MKRAGVVALELSRGWETLGRWWVRLIVAWGAILRSWRVVLTSVSGVSHPGVSIRQVALPGPRGDLLRWLRAHVTDTRLIAGSAALISVVAYAWYDYTGLTVGYIDALSRMVIARRVVAGSATGLAQLGTTWLPLHTMMMLPFIWNDTLFHDGIAGAIPSMVAYVLAAVYMYRIVYLLVASRTTAWLAALIFMLNPSVIYMQSTAMSEIPLLCAATIAIYYMLCWVRSYYVVDLVKSAMAVAVGAGIRYDGWALAVVLALVVIYVAWRRQGYAGAESHAIIYGMLAFSSCVAWVIYNAVIFHDPFLFLFFGNRSHTVVHLQAYHKPLYALEMFGFAAGAMAGWAMAGIAVLGLLLFLFRYPKNASILPVFALLIPIAYHWVIFYAGINSILLPQLGELSYWNARFGLMLMPAVVVFAAYLAHQHRLLRIGVLGVVVVFLIFNETVQVPLALREPTSGPTAHIEMRESANWLLGHYHGGKVLISDAPDAPAVYFLLRGLPDQALITDAQGPLFKAALARPQDEVKWIIYDDAGIAQDAVWSSLHNRQDWRQYFVLRQQFNGIGIYEFVGDAGMSSAQQGAVLRAQQALRFHDPLIGSPYAGVLVRPR